MAKTTTNPVSRKTVTAKAPAEAPRSIKAKAAAITAPKPEAKAPKVPPRMSASTRKAFEAAEKGILPRAPDFSAATHKPYRARLDALVTLTEAGDLAGLEAVEMLPPRSTSPKALHRYRDLAMVALRARAAR